MLNVWWYLEKMLPLQTVYEKTMIEEPFNEYEIFEEEDGLTLKVESCSWRGIDIELQELHYVHGASFFKQLKLITDYGEFHPVEGETNIFSTGGERSEDYNNQLNAARKAVVQGYKVYILPNPKGIRTADFTDYNPSTLARNIKHYFESNSNAIEVLIFKGKKQLSVTRKSLEDNHFFQTFAY